MFYSIFGAEIIPTAHTTNKCKTFCKTSENWYQGGDINFLIRVLS